MTDDRILNTLREPELTIAGLQLWVHGREFPDCHEYYNGNWLNVTAHCEKLGEGLRVSGAILMVRDLERFANECEALGYSNTTEARLVPFEPELEVVIRRIDAHGHFAMYVQITPDRPAQKHSFEFSIDQTYLPEIIKQCRAIVAAYPIRDG